MTTASHHSAPLSTNCSYLSYLHLDRHPHHGPMSPYNKSPDSFWTIRPLHTIHLRPHYRPNVNQHSVIRTSLCQPPRTWQTSTTSYSRNLIGSRYGGVKDGWTEAFSVVGVENMIPLWKHRAMRSVHTCDMCCRSLLLTRGRGSPLTYMDTRREVALDSDPMST